MMSSGASEFHGYVEDTRDALILIEASAQGLILQRKTRLSLEDRLQIRSGSTFIYNESVTNFKRWSDGISWGPSRLVNGFFVYQQQSTLPYAAKDHLEEVQKPLDKHDILHKKAIVAVAPNGDVFHLFNYYRPSDVLNGRLSCPRNTSLNELPNLDEKIALYTFKGMTVNPVTNPSNASNQNQSSNPNQFYRQLYGNASIQLNTQSSFAVSRRASTQKLFEPKPKRIKNGSSLEDFLNHPHSAQEQGQEHDKNHKKFSKEFYSRPNELSNQAIKLDHQIEIPSKTKQFSRLLLPSYLSNAHSQANSTHNLMITQMTNELIPAIQPLPLLAPLNESNTNLESNNLRYQRRNTFPIDAYHLDLLNKALKF